MDTKDELERPKNPLTIDIKTLWRTLINKNVDKPSDLANWIIKPYIVEKSIEPRLTWIGHSTFLIQINGLNGIIDPFWDDYKFAGITLYNRLVEAAINLDELPKELKCILVNFIEHISEGDE